MIDLGKCHMNNGHVKVTSAIHLACRQSGSLMFIYEVCASFK